MGQKLIGTFGLVPTNYKAGFLVPIQFCQVWKQKLSKDLVQLIFTHQNSKRSGGPAFVINDTYRIATSGRKKRTIELAKNFQNSC